MDVLTRVDRERIADGRPFWLDLADPSIEEVERVGALLGLHPVALEDTREFGQRPKVDVYEDNVLLVFFTARLDEQGSARPIEVHVYVAAGFVLTVRREQCLVLDDLRGRLEDGHPVYQILDTLTDAFYPVIDGLEQRVDALEYEVLTRARREQLAAIYRLRQEVRELGRLAIAQRDQFQAAADELRSQIAAAEDPREYLRDIGDHLAQVAGELQRQNEDLAALTSTYFNANTDKVNRTATRLSVIATFFVVWTLVTGFFGQNFQWLVDNVESRTDFLVFGVAGFIVPTVGLAALLWWKRRDWF